MKGEQAVQAGLVAMVGQQLVETSGLNEAAHSEMTGKPE